MDDFSGKVYTAVNKAVYFLSDVPLKEQVNNNCMFE